MPVYNVRGGQNVHQDVVLTNISIGFPTLGFVGPVLFPAVRVRKQSDKYFIHGRETWSIHPGGDYRAPGTVANEIPGLQLSTDNYFAQEHSLQIPVTPEERENADAPLSPDRDATELVTSKVLLAREITIQSIATTAANYASGHSVTLSGTSQWSDYVNSDPIGDFRTAFRTVHAKIFMEPNLAIIPYQVMSQLEDHPDFIERIKYSERGILTAEISATILGVQTVIVPGVGYNSANPGQSPSLGYLWGKDVVIAWVPPRPGLKIPSYGYEFVWGYNGTQEQITEKWYNPDRKADLIRVSRRYDLKMTAKDALDKQIAGYLIKAAVA
jgi:hypothetical protein